MLHMAVKPPVGLPVESSKLHVKKKVDMRVRKKYRQGQSADLTDPANTPTSVKLQAY